MTTKRASRSRTSQPKKSTTRRGGRGPATKKLNITQTSKAKTKTTTKRKGQRIAQAKRAAAATKAAQAAAPTSSARTTVTAAHMRLILNRIHDNACVPFLGAAANVTNKNKKYTGLPLGTDVAKEILQLISTFTGRDQQNLARITLEYEFETDRPFLVDELIRILPDQQSTPSPLLKALAKLPFKLIITTNYDRLMEKALAERNVNYRALNQPRTGWPDTRQKRQYFEKLDAFPGLILYKIHGSFDVEQGETPPPSVIITEDDYIEFLTVLGRQKDRIGIPNLIIKRIVPSTLLFFGYSLEDWDFRTIYKGWIESLPPHGARKSFAFQKDPPGFWVDFWSSKGVEIYNVDLYDFAQELSNQYAQYVRTHGKPLPRGKRTAG